MGAQAEEAAEAWHHGRSPKGVHALCWQCPAGFPLCHSVCSPGEPSSRKDTSLMVATERSLDMAPGLELWLPWCILGGGGQCYPWPHDHHPFPPPPPAFFAGEKLGKANRSG